MMEPVPQPSCFGGPSKKDMYERLTRANETIRLRDSELGDARRQVAEVSSRLRAEQQERAEQQRLVEQQRIQLESRLATVQQEKAAVMRLREQLEQQLAQEQQRCKALVVQHNVLQVVAAQGILGGFATRN